MSRQSKKDSYPARINHRSWPWDRACPLWWRYAGVNRCRRDIVRQRMNRFIPFGCPPDCAYRERALQEPGMRDWYEDRKAKLKEDNGWKL